MVCVAAVLLLSLACGAAGAPLNVHIVPHTHDDVGWLKNVDQYYSGANDTIQHAGVRYILTSVVDALAKDPARKFTYVEQAFFQRWWREQSEAVKEVTRKLVASKQLTFVNGGWCMHDEAAAHYIDMVDQTTLGHRLLKEEFNYVPTVGWQLDPFGHSATQASLLSAEAGFDALYFGRIDYQDLAKRTDESRCEFVWRASPSLGADAQVFAGLTGSYHGNYGPPGGFNWNVNSNDEPIEDNKDLETYNVKSRVDDFVAQALVQGSHTRGNHIMMTMGSDFQYEGAEHWYINLDKIIKHSNLDGRINAFYSSPEEYTAAKKAEAASGAVTWPLDTGNNSDFFPYADGAHQFWTGYFTSRPALKRYIRVNSALMNAARQMQVLGGVTPGSSVLQKYEEAMGVNQHHDAVSGTAKQHVAFDYAKRVASGQTSAESLISGALSNLAGSSSWTSCRRLNETVCAATQQHGAFSLAVWNQMGQARTEMISVPISSANATVVDANTGRAIPVQVMAAGETVTNYKRHTNEASHVAVFRASLPPVGFNTYRLTPTAGDITMVPSSDLTLENEHVQLVFSSTSGRLTSWTNKESNVKINAVQDFCYYRSSTGDSSSSQASGAYIFRPDSAKPACIPVGGDAMITLTAAGPHVWEVTQVFSDYVTQTVRLAAGERHAEFSFTVGPIPLADSSTNSTVGECVSWRQTGGCSANGNREPKNDKPCHSWIDGQNSGYCECHDGRKVDAVNCGHSGFTCFDACAGQIGKEIVSKFTTSIASGGRMATDSNGREMLHRRRDFRPTWNLSQTEPVAGNYFPINSAAAIMDGQAQLTVLVDAAQGAASITDGSIELMVHRRLLADDHRGVGEPLNETQFTASYAGPHGGMHSGPGLIVRGTHWVALTTPLAAAKTYRALQERLYARPVLAVASSPGTKPSFSAVEALPANVQLMTLHSIDKSSILMRLAHLFGIGEDAKLSLPATVDISAMFRNLKIASVEEVSLTNNQKKAEIMARRRAASLWQTDGPAPHPWRGMGPLDFTQNTTTTLGPLEIKTFVVHLA